MAAGRKWGKDEVHAWGREGDRVKQASNFFPSSYSSRRKWRSLLGLPKDTGRYGEEENQDGRWKIELRTGWGTSERITTLSHDFEMSSTLSLSGTKKIGDGGRNTVVFVSEPAPPPRHNLPPFQLQPFRFLVEGSFSPVEISVLPKVSKKHDVQAFCPPGPGGRHCPRPLQRRPNLRRDAAAASRESQGVD